MYLSERTNQHKTTQSDFHLMKEILVIKHYQPKITITFVKLSFVGWGNINKASSTRLIKNGLILKVAVVKIFFHLFSV